MVKFFKTLEYTFSQREQAEKDLRSALETISSEEGELSSKAPEWLRNFDVMRKSSSAERHWTSTKVNEEREKTRALKLISAEKEEQHFFIVKSNIADEHDSASDDFRARIQERFNKRPSSFEESLHESDSNKKVKSSGQEQMSTGYSAPSPLSPQPGFKDLSSDDSRGPDLSLSDTEIVSSCPRRCSTPEDKIKTVNLDEVPSATTKTSLYVPSSPSTPDCNISE
ncbi:hypothetical protein RhiirA4_496198 [Rhizophagus irregularis]|uniref:Uncharacterized protein n=1 Tax=Rhizophagus irregularis TaxID=588596 RepID=A0A2I1H091_9GLOM|nr:hypothetical protein RhiirA4_496198 [Rhizophagus irregularis]